MTFLLKTYSAMKGKLRNGLKSLKRLFPSGEEAEKLKLYELMAQHLTASVMIKDGAGQILYCNPYTETLTGHPLEHFYDSEKNFFSLIIEKEDQDVYSRASKITSLGEAFQFCYRILHAGGFELWVETRTTPVLDTRGNIAATVSITTDVTRRVKFQKQVEEKNNDLKDLTYMISHDLKGPIFTIKGMLNIVNDEHHQSISPEVIDIFGHISDAQMRLESLVVDVLEYANIGSEINQNELIDLNSLIKDIFKECELAYQMSDASLEIESEVPALESDRIKLYQIFNNLFSNAFKYKKVGIPLHVKVYSRQSTDGRLLTISVTDNGSGIALEDQEKIFRPFQRASEAHSDRSSGVGLACVAKLVKKLNGEIDLKSEPDKGSTFSVTFPTYPLA